MSDNDDGDIDGYPPAEANASTIDQSGQESSSSSSTGSSPTSTNSSPSSMTPSDPATSLANSLLSSHNLPESLSLIEYYGSGSSSCGYCKKEGQSKHQWTRNKTGRKSFDMKAYQLRADDYCKLLDRGWRRSGRYCYKPINETTCCPNYSISCKALEFKLSGSQRRCIKKINTFLMTGDRNIAHNNNLIYDDSERTTDTSDRLINTSFEQLKKSAKLRDRRLVTSCERKARLNNISPEEAFNNIREKWASKQYQSLSLESYLYPKHKPLIDSTPKHRLEINMLQVDSSESKALRDEEHRIIELYQESVHKEGPEEWTMRRFCSFLVDTPLILEKIQNFDFVNGANDEESCNFQCPSHQTKGTDEGDENLLVKPPALPTHFGTYHCSYHLDGKLIGVGVLDVLPKCITTVYFFYDPEYNFLNLGTYSALIEISMVRHIHKHYIGSISDNRLIYYYLGYYVHECEKMHYKPKFKPSYLLCSETNTYVPTELCLLKLRDRKYARFAEPGIEGWDKNMRFEDSYVYISRMSMVVPELASLNKMSQYFEWLSENLGINYVYLMISSYLCPLFRIIGPDLAERLVMHGGLIHRGMLERFRRETQGQSSNRC